ncbi:concanavalin A-like lectin/glucanase superfamily protein [Flavobacterium sp. 1]|uniref:LamG domain-containing protein n=1 Tax=Flavobacterium sp. 1 TaxID=2035200 RepID=UPI000C2332C6|nr:LamG domain-containing protein [Flavobacterium sp. 1]PJJ08665.1 concanavalin A-like lectin/glucanase superfamily protein [Flavobacterium sp. 1]
MGSLKKYVFGKMQKPLIEQLVAYYKFNSNAIDSTGLSPNGTVTNATFVTGKMGNAINFNNNTARVDFSDHDNFSFTTGNGNDVPFSISMWVYFTVFNSGNPTFNGNWLINKRADTPGTDEWQLALYEGNLYFSKFDRVTKNNYQYIIVANPFTLNTWYHIVVTDNGTKTVAGLRMYINSALISTTPIEVGTYTGMPNSSALMRIGLNAWNLITPSIRHQGNIDEVGIWKNRCLTPREISELYNGGLGNTYPFI